MGMSFATGFPCFVMTIPSGSTLSKRARHRSLNREAAMLFIMQIVDQTIIGVQSEKIAILSDCPGSLDPAGRVGPVGAAVAPVMAAGHLREAATLLGRPLRDLLLDVGDGLVVLPHRADIHAARAARVDPDPTQDRLPDHERLL